MYKDKSQAKKLSALMKTKDKLRKGTGNQTEDNHLELVNKCLQLAETVLKRPHMVLYDLEDEVHGCLLSKSRPSLGLQSDLIMGDRRLELHYHGSFQQRRDNYHLLHQIEWHRSNLTQRGQPTKWE